MNYSMAGMLLCNTSLILSSHKRAQPWFPPVSRDAPSSSTVPRHSVGAADQGKSPKRPRNEQLVQLCTTKSAAASLSALKTTLLPTLPWLSEGTGKSKEIQPLQNGGDLLLVCSDLVYPSFTFPLVLAPPG